MIQGDQSPLAKLSGMSRTSGRLIAIVGPSGVGKDTVMAAMAATDPRLDLVRRVITRPGAAGGEAFESVGAAGFMALRDTGGFALWWEAHGLHYGIPVRIHDDLAAGRDMLANLSRSVLVAAQERFPDLVVIALRASPDILAARLAQRGREKPDDIAQRLARVGPDLPKQITPIDIDNSRALDFTVAAALAALYPARV